MDSLTQVILIQPIAHYTDVIKSSEAANLNAFAFSQRPSELIIFVNSSQQGQI